MAASAGVWFADGRILEARAAEQQAVVGVDLGRLPHPVVGVVWRAADLDARCREFARDAIDVINAEVDPRGGTGRVVLRFDAKCSAMPSRSPIAKVAPAAGSAERKSRTAVVLDGTGHVRGGESRGDVQDAAGAALSRVSVLCHLCLLPHRSHGPSERAAGRGHQPALATACAYSSSVTWRPQVAGLPLASFSCRAIWAMKRSGAAPCQ